MSVCLPLLSSLALVPYTKSRRRFLLAQAHPGSPVKRAVKRLCVCVCVCYSASILRWFLTAVCTTGTAAVHCTSYPRETAPAVAAAYCYCYRVYLRAMYGLLLKSIISQVKTLHATLHSLLRAAVDNVVCHMDTCQLLQGSTFCNRMHSDLGSSRESLSASSDVMAN